MKFYLKENLYIIALAMLSMTLLTNCNKSIIDTDENQLDYHLELGNSILVQDGNILVSGIQSKNKEITSKFWINGKNATKSEFIKLTGNQSGFHEAINEDNKMVYTYKKSENDLIEFQFYQTNFKKNSLMPYFENGQEVRIESDSTGLFSSVSMLNNKPIFAGTYGEFSQLGVGGASYHPKSAFTWDEQTGFTELIIPEESTLFWGVSTIYSAGPNETYVGGYCGIPMYWKNKQAIVLNKNLYGEVREITKEADNIYAVGLINKINSNSSGHTACYWKNGEIHELQDNAQAYGIFVDGNDVYITGATGRVPTEYKPCYWKNGKRVDLEM